MVNLEVNEITYIYKVISEQNIKGADAPFVANILNKMANEATKLKNKVEKTKK
jgi:hypothetical protein